MSIVHQPRLLAFLFVAASLAAVAQPGEFIAPVIGISDGDTIRVLDGGVSKRIRLWGIDCPEMRQSFGSRAKQFTADLAFGQTVTVRVHDTDRYGRKVAEIILPDGKNLNHEIMRAGFAWWYVRYARHDRELEQLEAEAKAAKRGLWADANPTPPWEFRKRKNSASLQSLPNLRMTPFWSQAATPSLISHPSQRTGGFQLPAGTAKVELAALP